MSEYQLTQKRWLARVRRYALAEDEIEERERARERAAEATKTEPLWFKHRSLEDELPRVESYSELIYPREGV